jgi:hypothetical protein
MYQVELRYFLILTVIILSTPFLPTGLLLLLDNLFIRIGIVILLLYLISIGPTAGIFGLLMIGVLYLERNRSKVKIAKKKLDKMDLTESKMASVEDAAKPQQTVPVPSFDKPIHSESEFLPNEEPCDITMFEPVAPSINEKAVLSTVYPLAGNESGSGSSELFEQLGFGHIKGVETLGDS